jgi:cytochrome b pre-mRNA-processing protein 3
LETRVLSWFRSRAQDRRTAIDFYGAIVTHARHPAFFVGHDAAGDREYGVSDTPEGRTAMIIVLMFPLLERLQHGSHRERRVARLLAETFVTDIDDCLREMGVGDMSVPKKVKRAAQALGERCLAYRRAAASPEPAAALAQELATTVPGLDTAPQGAEALASLTLQSLNGLRSIPAEKLLTGAISFPEPSHLIRGAA